MAVLLHTSSYFWPHLFPSRFQIDRIIFSDLSFTRITTSRERIAFSLDIFASIQRDERLTDLNFFEAQKNLVIGPISGQRKINPQHGQGQLARQKVLRCNDLSEGKVECQGQEISSGRTIGVIVLVGDMIEIIHLSCQA